MSTAVSIFIGFEEIVAATKGCNTRLLRIDSCKRERVDDPGHEQARAQLCSA